MNAMPGVIARDACDSCGEIPVEEASSCARCGAPLDGRAPAPSRRLEWCAIVIWRGYRYFEFCAVAADGTLLGRSRGFPRRGSQEPAESERSRAAHAQLTGELERAGWEIQ